MEEGGRTEVKKKEMEGRERNERKGQHSAPRNRRSGCCKLMGGLRHYQSESDMHL